MNAPAIPRDLFIVACLFLFWGCDGLINTSTAWIHDGLVNTAAAWMNGHNFKECDLSCVGVLIFFGLVFSWSGWRMFALVFLAIAASVGAIALLQSVVTPFHSLAAPYARHLKILGMHLSISRPLWIAYLAVLFSLVIWEWSVLMRPKVAARFRRQTRPVSSAFAT